jgi:hypothetical protein
MDPLGVPSVAQPLSSAVDIVLSFGVDFFTFIILTAIIAAFAFYLGGDRLMPLTAAIYTAVLLYAQFPYKQYIPDNPYIQIALYILLVLVGLLAFSGLSYFMSGGAIGIFKLLGLSVLIAGLLLAISIHTLPLDKVYALSVPTKALFEGDLMYFWWLVAPLGGLFLFGRG